MAHDRWTQFNRTELIARGKDLVTDRLQQLGCTVAHAANPVDGKLRVRTRTSRSLEVFVTTQRVGGYAFWTKRRLQPAPDRYAVLVLVADAAEPALHIVPSTAWLNAAPPLTDRDYVGRKSEPEYGIELGRASVSLLSRYGWTAEMASTHFA